MKFGCCLNMVATMPDKIGAEHLSKLAELGYDYVEFPLAEMTALSDEEFEIIKSKISNSGVLCETCNNFFPGTLRLTGEEIDRKLILAYMEKALGRAQELGTQYVVFGSGKAKNIPENFPIESGYQQVVKLLKDAATIAKVKNITIVIEPLRKAECNLINTFKEGCKLAADVNDENVKVLVDFYHLTEEQEPIEHLITMGKKYLRHVHFANSHGRIYPETLEEDNYKPFFDALREIGYDQRVSCEAYAEDYDTQAEKTIRFFRENL